MDELRDDPDYELRWPHDMLAAELDALIARALEDGSDQQWREEVGHLAASGLRLACAATRVL